MSAFWFTSLAAEMEYRVNFLVAAINSLGQLAGTLFTLNILYRKGYHFAGWSWHEALLVVGLFTLLDGMASTLLSPNLSRIVQHVQNGTLDFILLKPLDPQFQLSTRNMSPWGFPNVVFALVLLVYAGMQVPLPAAAYALGIIPMILSGIILYTLWFAVATTTIWFTKVWNATEVLRSFLEAGKYPMSAYPVAYQFFFTFILPVAFLTTVPAEVMRGQHSAAFILIEAAVALTLFVVTRCFWKFALRSYTSASS